MDAIYEKCCGLDVHQATVVACAIISEGKQRPKRHRRTFGTVAGELRALAAWLTELGVTHVGMESTGVYWMPVYRALEGRFELVVGNAQHIKNVPGRKTDKQDSEWLADLVRCGLIRRSFVPPPAIRELRELVRFRRTLVDDQVRIRNRIQKWLEVAGIKLATVASDVFGRSGRAMLAALVNGEADAERLAQLARSSLRSKIPALRAALEGGLADEHRYLIGFELKRLAQIEQDLAAHDQRIDLRLEPYRKQLDLLTPLPGFDRITAAAFIAETGGDMSVFPTSGHLAAWTGVAPGSHESAGRRRQVGVRKGNVHLRTALFQATMGAVRKKGSYYKAKYWRLTARRGPQRARMAIAHKLLIAAYEVLKSDQPFRDLGDQYLARRSASATKQRFVDGLKDLGYDVTLTPRVVTS